jgi:hypothetical protein
LSIPGCGGISRSTSGRSAATTNVLIIAWTLFCVQAGWAVLMVWGVTLQLGLEAGEDALRATFGDEVTAYIGLGLGILFIGSCVLGVRLLNRREFRRRYALDRTI